MLRKKCLEFVKTKQKNNKNITTNSITGNKNNFHFNSSFRKINTNYYTTQNNEIIRLEKLLEVSISGAKEASKSIKNIWKSNDLGIVHKGESATDLLTKADLSSHTILINRLTNEFKNLKIISEEDIFSNEKDVLSTSKVPETPLNLKISEQFEYLTTDEVCLFIDPLDGTIGFTNGHLESTMILIGVAYYGKPIAGIMCQPFYSNGEEEEEYGRIICGVVGSGCVSTSPLQKLEKPATFNNENIRLVTTLYHTTAVMEDTIEKFPPSTQVFIFIYFLNRFSIFFITNN